MQLVPNIRRSTILQSWIGKVNIIFFFFIFFFLKIIFLNRYTCANSGPCGSIEPDHLISVACTGDVCPTLKGSTFNILGSPVSAFYNSGDTANIQCPSGIGSVVARVGTNCPRASNVIECNLCDLQDNTKNCVLPISGYEYILFIFYLSIFIIFNFIII